MSAGVETSVAADDALEVRARTAREPVEAGLLDGELAISYVLDADLDQCGSWA
jgi:hypothetical protein